MSIIRTLTAFSTIFSLAICAELAQAQPDTSNGNDPLDRQTANDQQVDLALGTLDAPLLLRLVLSPPQVPAGTRGPQPFAQQPPAAQSDFGTTTVVGPRGKIP